MDIPEDIAFQASDGYTLRGFRMSYLDWAQLDLAALIDLAARFAAVRTPAAPLWDQALDWLEAG